VSAVLGRENSLHSDELVGSKHCRICALGQVRKCELPTNEQQLNTAQVGGAALIGASIAVTTGVYPAELQAIARALPAFPLICSLHIHSDSQAAIAGIFLFFKQPPSDVSAARAEAEAAEETLLLLFLL